MKKVVKLDSKRLRSIIMSEVKRSTRGRLQEAIIAKPFGAPEGVWIDESVADESMGPQLYNDINELVDKVGNVWRGIAENGDPSFELTGRDAWEMQVDDAQEDLLNQISTLIDDIEEKLINGEYYRG